MSNIKYLSLFFLDSPSLNIEDAMTIAFWMSRGDNQAQYYDQRIETYSYVFRKIDASIVARLNQDGTLSSQGLIIDTPLDEWTHYCFVVDEDGNTALYVNGVLSSTGTRTMPLAVSSNPLRIAVKNGAHFCYDGMLDEFALYNRALSTEEIQTLMECNGDISIYEQTPVEEDTLIEEETPTEEENPTKEHNCEPEIIEVEKFVEVEKIVEKEVIVEVPVEKIVYVEKIVEVPGTCSNGNCDIQGLDHKGLKEKSKELNRLIKELKTCRKKIRKAERALKSRKSIIGGQFKARKNMTVKVTSLGKDAAHHHILYAVIGKKKVRLFNSADKGKTVNLGKFPKGRKIQFMLHNLTTDKKYFTGKAKKNPDNVVHAKIQETDKAHIWTFGFEDIWKGGDKDYNDCMFKISGVYGS